MFMCDPHIDKTDAKQLIKEIGLNLYENSALNRTLYYLELCINENQTSIFIAILSYKNSFIQDMSPTTL
jgi:hypothetical protein